MKKIIYIYISIILSLGIVSCSDSENESIDFSKDVDIHSFVINGVEGVIKGDNSTILVTLPNGTDLQGLAPEIAIGEGAIVSPESGESVDFLDNDGNLVTVTYTVSNQDVYQKYYVSADIARAKISSFKIDSIYGIIDDLAQTITIYLPVGTNLTGLIPVLEYTEGATLTPESGTVTDLSQPVSYILEYLGSTFTYVATAILGDQPRPIVTIYNGEDVSPIWASLASTLNNGYANPETDGINTTSRCIAIMRNKEDSDDGGKAWSGGALWNAYKVDIDPAEYSKFTLMVLKEVAGDVQLEVQSDGEQDKDWLRASYSAEALGQWQELTFLIPESRTAIINNILVATHPDDTSADPNFTSHMMYWDELRVHPKE